MIAPCKGCPKRQAYCHCTCEAYLQFAEEREAYRQAMRYTDSDQYAIERTQKRKARIRRKEWTDKNEV